MFDTLRAISFGHLEQGHVFARTRRTLDLEVVSVELVEIEQSPDQQTIHRHPDWARQLESPPNIPVFDSAGRYSTL